jgi:hypothetical protein
MMRNNVNSVLICSSFVLALTQSNVFAQGQTEPTRDQKTYSLVENALKSDAYLTEHVNKVKEYGNLAREKLMAVGVPKEFAYRDYEDIHKDFIVFTADRIMSYEDRERRRFNEADVVSTTKTTLNDWLANMACIAASTEEARSREVWLALAPLWKNNDFSWNKAFRDLERACNQHLSTHSLMKSDVVGNWLDVSQIFNNEFRENSLSFAKIVRSSSALNFADIINYYKPTMILNENNQTIARFPAKGEFVEKVEQDVLRPLSANQRRRYCQLDARWCYIFGVMEATNYIDHCQNSVSYFRLIQPGMPLATVPLPSLERVRSGESFAVGGLAEGVMYGHFRNNICLHTSHHTSISEIFSSITDRSYFLKKSINASYQNPHVENMILRFERYISDPKQRIDFVEKINSANMWEAFIGIVENLGDYNFSEQILRYRNIPALRVELLNSIKKLALIEPTLNFDALSKDMPPVPIEIVEGSKDSEVFMYLDPTLIQEIQVRLNSLGADVPVSGQIGEKTRSAIKFWQGTSGYPPTGFLNWVQYDDLKSRTASTKVDYAALPAPRNAGNVSRNPGKEKSSAGPNQTRNKNAARQGSQQRRTGDRRQPQRQDDGAQQFLGTVLRTVVPIIERCARGGC